MIVFDASTVVGAAIRPGSVPNVAVRRAWQRDRFALSAAVYDEIAEVLHRPRLARFIDPIELDEVLDLLTSAAAWFEPGVRVHDCRDLHDNMYLELALAAHAQTIVSSDGDLLALHPWREVRILTAAEYLAAAG